MLKELRSPGNRMKSAFRSQRLSSSIVTINWHDIKHVWILIRLFRLNSGCHLIKQRINSHSFRPYYINISQNDDALPAVWTQPCTLTGFTVAGTLWNEWKPLELGERVCLQRATCKLLVFFFFLFVVLNPATVVVVSSERSCKCRETFALIFLMWTVCL